MDKLLGVWFPVKVNSIKSNYVLRLFFNPQCVLTISVFWDSLFLRMKALFHAFSINFNFLPRFNEKLCMRYQGILFICSQYPCGPFYTRQTSYSNYSKFSKNVLWKDYKFTSFTFDFALCFISVLLSRSP